MSRKIEEMSEQKISNNNDRDKFASVKEETEDYDKFKILEQWLISNNTKFNKLELRDYGNEVRGSHALKDINEDEIIIQVPLKCLITVEMGKETEIGLAILSSSIELDAPKHIFLMIFMLVDRKNPKSFFKPYYDILPKTLNNMPIFWNTEELAYLTGSYILTQIEERNIAIESDYLAICSLIPTFPQTSTLEEFKWARMCVCSRNFGLIINGVRTAALVPYADMLNHLRPRETKWQFDDYLQGFTVTSLQGIRPGAQVYDSYGQKCNHRFLLNYGFSIENNREPDGFNPNEVPVLVQMSRTDPFYELKLAIWRRDSSLPSRRVRIGVCDNENTRALFSMLRIIEAGQDDLEQLLTTVCGSPVSNISEFIDASSAAASGFHSGYRYIRDAQNGINVLNEIKAMRYLEVICNEYLSKYPTTFDDDCHRLSGDSLAPFSNERHAVIQVKGEKEILLFYLEYAVKAQELLKINSVKEFEEKLSAIREHKSTLFYQLIRVNIVRIRLEEQKNVETKQSFVDFTKPMIV